MIEHPFDNLGGKPRPHDPRDVPLGGASPEVHPAAFLQDSAWNAPIFYQGKRPACGAHAGAWAKMLLDINDGKSPYPTPRATWIDIKRDGASPSDGTDMRSIFNSLKNTGIVPFEPLENDVTLPDEAYASGVVLPTSDVIASYGFDNGITFDALKQYIYDHKAVVLLIEVGDEMWTATNGMTSWQEKDVLPLRPPKAVVSGHFIVAHSYDEHYIYFANSWSTTWGRKGHGYFGENYLSFVKEVGAPVNAASIDTQVAQVVNAVPTLIQEVQNQPQSRRAALLLTIQNILQQALSLLK